jgi:hypothetical protein
MWEKYQRITVNRDHGLVIQKTYRPGTWFAAGTALLAPLYRKRTLLVDRSKWIHAWTLYNETLGAQGWITPPDVNTNLHLPIEIRTRQPTGWIFTIPPELRRKGWLPESGGNVIYEYNDTEANFWTEAVYNEETILEADAC